MAESKGKPEGEHIEELLSQLKGIFGHLSESEQEEAKQKITPPPLSNKPPAPGGGPAMPAPAPAPEPFSPMDAATSFEHPAIDPFSDMVPMNASPAEPAPPPPSEAPSDMQVPPPSPDFAPAEVNVPTGASLIPAAVFYPAGRMTEAKLVTDKIEKITPKFTKVQVVISVQSLVSYEPKSDVKAAVTSQTEESIRAVFLLIDKALDDARRKALIAHLEPKGIYFQEIPFHQIEKKALYTDMLLGMVFFFDSQKKPEPPGESA